MKIYTRTGDKGQTSLVDGTRVSKSSVRVETYGTIDELNTVLGLVLAHSGASYTVITKELEAIQHDLFAIGAYLATPENLNQESGIMNYEKRVKDFEKQIDQMTSELASLKYFILPGGGEVASFLHLARSVCRRAERCVVSLTKKETVDPSVLQYFNRLSDLLFTMARYANKIDKQKEIIWQK